MLPKILIACPVHESKRYCTFDWIEQMPLLTYENFQIFLCDNSETDEFCREINAYGIECERIDPRGKLQSEKIALSHERCRQKAIEIGAEYLLHWEVDVFTKHRDLIELLVMRGKAVVGALYYIGFGKDAHLCVTVRTQKYRFELATALNLKDGADLMFVDGKCKQVASVGLGALLLHRSVFTKIPFRHDRLERAYPDSCFAEDLFHAGIPVFADTSLLMEHRNSKWNFSKKTA
jgi:hypothetical protein